MRITEAEYHHLLALSGQPLPDNVAEARFQAQVVRLARDLGYLCYFTHDSRHSPSGFMDLILTDARPGVGKVYAWELKTARGKPTMDQLMWLAALDGKRVEVGLYRPGDLAAMVAKLRGEQP